MPQHHPRGLLPVRLCIDVLLDFRDSREDEGVGDARGGGRGGVNHLHEAEDLALVQVPARREQDARCRGETGGFRALGNLAYGERPFSGLHDVERDAALCALGRLCGVLHEAVHAVESGSCIAVHVTLLGWLGGCRPPPDWGGWQSSSICIHNNIFRHYKTEKSCARVQLSQFFLPALGVSSVEPKDRVSSGVKVVPESRKRHVEVRNASPRTRTSVHAL